TQPQGHSTSGSHERYKSKERLAWEAEFDCNRKMREWIINEVMVLPEEVDAIEQEAKRAAKQARDNAWQAFTEDIQKDQTFIMELLSEAGQESSEKPALEEI